MLSARDPIRRRQPVERPLDIVALELLVSVTQALLAGILLALATQLGGDARAYGLPVPGLLAILGFAVGVGWLRWLMGGSGWVMASVCLATSVLAGALWLLALQDAGLPRIDPLVGLIAVACALYGLAAGVFLDGPHRAHWKGGVSQPHRGVPQTRATPARFSPPVQKVVDERLSDLHLPQVSLPSAPRVSMPSVKRPTRSTVASPPATGDGLTVADQVVAQPPTTATPVTSEPEKTEPITAVVAPVTPATETPEAATAEAATAEAATAEAATAETPTAEGPTAEAPTAEAPTALTASTEAVLPPPEPSTTVGADPVGETQADPVGETQADPDAPTQPVAAPAPQWPRPIEPRGHTGSHKVDPDT